MLKWKFWQLNACVLVKNISKRNLLMLHKTTNKWSYWLLGSKANPMIQCKLLSILKFIRKSVQRINQHISKHLSFLLTPDHFLISHFSTNLLLSFPVERESELFFPYCILLKGRRRADTNCISRICIWCKFKVRFESWNYRLVLFFIYLIRLVDCLVGGCAHLLRALELKI